MTSVRTRFAPSPTGLLHVGGIRTALFAYLLARQAHGQFIVRLEDTDKKREVAGADQHILDCLQALGLEYDEGPEKAGPFGPYRQSERLDSYKQWAQKLIDAGRAYSDPYTPEQVQGFRELAQANRQPFLYRNHRPDKPPVWDGTTPLRFKSEPKAYQWHDTVMGDLATGPEVIDDFILIKSDGYPTYNFAHIVDDAEMHITHVIRGQEFIASTPNYLNLYEALGLDRPILATMPHILAATGGKKLSKRDGAKDVLDYIRDGYLPEAMVNFIASMGWNDGTEQEIFSKEELIAKFSLDHVQKSGARFDEQRLLWLNGQWIRKIDLNDLYNRLSVELSPSEDSALRQSETIQGFTLEASESEEGDSSKASRNNNSFWPSEAAGASEAYEKQILGLVQDRLKTLNDLPALTRYFFSEPTPDMSLIDNNKQLKKLAPSEQKSLISAACEALEQSDFSVDNLSEALNKLLETTGQKPGILFSLIRIVITWAPFSPGLAETIAILGRDRTLNRLNNFLS